MKIVNKPLKNEYLTTNQFEYNERLNDYINDLEIYTEFLEMQVKKLSLGVVSNSVCKICQKEILKKNN